MPSFKPREGGVAACTQEDRDALKESAEAAFICYCESLRHGTDRRAAREACRAILEMIDLIPLLLGRAT